MSNNPSMANAELAVMDLLWREDRMTARELRERLYPAAAKGQHGTVQRLLQRLEDTHMVEQKKISRAEIKKLRKILNVRTDAEDRDRPDREGR
jgi:predicted transcriptional regulator